MLLGKMFPALAELSVWTVILRLLLSTVCGGAVGMNREKKGRPAGFRTHILVCLGAALVMMINQYLALWGTTDLARLGAAVVSGIGFLGAGTIIVTQRNRVRGLTTAAGLWASAAVGLAVGIGFYEAAILACLIILAVEHLMDRDPRDHGEKKREVYRVTVRRMSEEEKEIYRTEKEAERTGDE